MTWREPGGVPNGSLAKRWTRKDFSGDGSGICGEGNRGVGVCRGWEALVEVGERKNEKLKTKNAKWGGPPHPNPLPRVRGRGDRNADWDAMLDDKSQGSGSVGKRSFSGDGAAFGTAGGGGAEIVTTRGAKAATDTAFDSQESHPLPLHDERYGKRYSRNPKKNPGFVDISGNHCRSAQRVADSDDPRITLHPHILLRSSKNRAQAVHLSRARISSNSQT
jgi:hypothetical protein